MKGRTEISRFSVPSLVPETFKHRIKLYLKSVFPEKNVICWLGRMSYVSFTATMRREVSYHYLFYRFVVRRDKLVLICINFFNSGRDRDFEIVDRGPMFVCCYDFATGPSTLERVEKLDPETGFIHSRRILRNSSFLVCLFT